MRLAIRLIIVAAVIIGAITAGNRKPRTRTTANGNTAVEVTKDDPRLAAATAEAKRRFGEFLQAYSKATDKSRFTIKANFKAYDGGSEQMFVAITSISGSSIIGTLTDTPIKNIGKKEGDKVSILVDNIEDRAYWDGTKIVGNFQGAIIDEIERGGGDK